MTNHPLDVELARCRQQLRLSTIDQANTEASLNLIRDAAKALLDDVRRRHPGEELRCPYMRALDEAVKETGR